MPWDDTIPQITEGNEYMTLAITPTSATNKLKIDVVFIGAHTGAPHNLTAALFQDATVNALACATMQNNTYLNTITFSHYMTADTTSATTFRIRAGSSGGATTTFNGQAGARKNGGVLASSITITEIQQ